MQGKKKHPRLSDRHRRVIDEYMANGFNREQAMLDCGYAASSARRRQDTIFERDDVKTEIARRMEIIGEKLEITAEKVIAELGKIAFLDLSNAVVRTDNGHAYIDASLLSDDQIAALASFETEEYKEGRGEGARDIIRVKIKMSDKKGALDSLARHFGLFNDKLTVTGELSLVERLQRGRERVSQKRDGEALDEGHSESVH